VPGVAATDQPIDQYAPLSHKAVLNGSGTATTSMAPTWVPAAERRRLDAYKVLSAYLGNCARRFLPTPGTVGYDSEGFGRHVEPDTAGGRREYGDAALIIDRIRAGVLGDQVTVVVDGADDDLPDEPDLPPKPEPMDTDADDLGGLAERVNTIRTDRWKAAAAQVFERWVTDLEQQPALVARQDWLRDWADSEGLLAKLHEGEGDTVGLGDGVYLLAWSEAKQRPVVQVYDPGFYFPVLDQTGSQDNDFPGRVHLAWEYETVDRKRWVRRLTFDLRPISGQPDDDGADTGRPFDGDKIDADGRIVRDYPWNVDDQNAIVPSTVTCYFTDATWPLAELGAQTLSGLDDLSLESRDVQFAVTEDGQEARDLDLRIDFVPIVHVPNTPATREHYGESALLLVAQILDDISASDTDVQAASALAAGPMVAMSGAGKTGTVEVRPGTVFQLPEGGRMDVLDMSAGLAELTAVNERLLDRLSVNGRVPAEVLGRVKVSEAPSGVALALGFGPFTQLVGTLRLVRDAKYRLMLKMVQRLAMGRGDAGLPDGPTMPARMAFGSYLPTDKQAVITQVGTALEAGAISVQTAVVWLVDAGFTVDDAKAEVQRIQHDNPSKAKDVADATGSEELAADYLGLTLPETATVPAPAVTEPAAFPVPGAGGQ